MNQIIHSLHIGFILNPLAGVGGPAALKGSDDSQLVAEAIAQGAELRAPERALRCLQSLTTEQRAAITLATFAGALGEDIAREAGFDPVILGTAESEPSTAEDTRRAAQALVAQGVDLILFAGGDGTARDICSVVGQKIPVLGMPSGVKMHSGVFAISPEAAAEVIKRMLVAELVDLCEQEVRDIDEAGLRQGVVRSRHYGDMQVPQVGHFVQQVKDGTGREIEELVLDDIAAELLERMEPDTLYLVGAGTTTQALMDQLGLTNTLLGVDVVCNECLVASDVGAGELEQLLAGHSGEVVAVLSITGGQGSLIGRGNQQFSPGVLKRVGRDNLWVVATKTKIRALQGRSLLMDSNDLALDRQWQGYIPVITGYRDTILYPLGIEV
ncbi:MAG: ATP-NAD kinase family protein [Candidatus Pelagadaptatus aseana]|uniref:ATP-NAD kinase family protein n=1 Tax=Candidatus Pelagadaptatus aseana TaxID=3120508 RepID=UPI0039B34C58